MDANVNFLLLPTFNAIRSFYDNMPYLIKVKMPLQHVYLVSYLN